MLNAEQVQVVIYEGLPQASEEGLVVESIGDRRARGVGSPFRPSALRPGGTFSGPTMMGLADAAMYAAVLGALGRVETAGPRISISTFSPGAERPDSGGGNPATGEPPAVLEVQLFSEGSDDMAHVTGTYAQLA